MDARLTEAIDALCTHGPDRLLVALDFDGTVAPLVDDPMTARPLPQADAAIRRLLASGVHLALVSGRNITDLAERAAPPPGTWLVGSHGAERGVMTDAGLHTDGLVLSDAQTQTLIDLIGALREVVEGRPGAWVQVKPSAAVVHTRQAAPESANAATQDAVATAARLGLPAMRGKNVVEIAVVRSSKGQALDTLRQSLESMHTCRVLFAGDDTTDEDAFKVLGPGDVGIKVGSGPTSAEHRVADPQELAMALDRLVERLSW